MNQLTRHKKIIKKTLGFKSVGNVLIKLQRPIVVEVGDKAILMKLDLPPRQFRIIGLADVVNLPETIPEIYSAKLKEGVVSKQISGNVYVVSGLFTKEGAPHVVGENVVTASRTKGTVVDPYGDKGDVLVAFQTPPRVLENAYWHRLRKVKIV